MSQRPTALRLDAFPSHCSPSCQCDGGEASASIGCCDGAHTSDDRSDQGPEAGQTSSSGSPTAGSGPPSESFRADSEVGPPACPVSIHLGSAGHTQLAMDAFRSPQRTSGSPTHLHSQDDNAASAPPSDMHAQADTSKLHMHDEDAFSTCAPLSVRVRSMATIGSATSIVSMHAIGSHSADHEPRLLGGVLRCSTASFLDEDTGSQSESSDTSESPVCMNERSEVVLKTIAVQDGKDPAESEVLEPLLPISKSAGPTALPATAAGAGAVAAPQDDVTSGMLYYAVSSVFYAGMAVCSKVLQDEGYPVWEVTFFRALVILAVSLSAILSAGGSPWGVRRGLLLLRGTLGYTSIALFFSACYFLPIATATTFSFFAPVIVALLSPWLLREAVSPATAVVIPLCIVGVVLVTQPAALFGGRAAALSVTGVVIGLAQPFFGATVKMVIRELRKTEATQVIIFYLVMCTLVYSCLGCAFTWRHLVTPASWRDCLLLFGLGVCGYGNQLCTTKGLAKAKAASVMSMQYCSIVFTQLAGVVLFAEYPSVVQCAGMGLIVASMVGYLWYEARTGKK